jgi:hypothetical protein
MFGMRSALWHVCLRKGNPELSIQYLRQNKETKQDG